MPHRPRELRTCESVRKAAAFLRKHKVVGAIVRDETGRPVRLLTRTDLADYAREHVEDLDQATIADVLDNPPAGSHNSAS